MGVNPRICYGVKSGTQGVAMALVCVYEMSQDEEQLRAFSVSVITAAESGEEAHYRGMFFKKSNRPLGPTCPKWQSHNA